MTGGDIIFSDLITMPYEHCSSKLKRQMRSLNMRMKGSMLPCLRSKYNTKVVHYILDEQDRLAAWALSLINFKFMPTHFYVRKAYRRMGLGTKLSKAAVAFAKTENKKMVYYPWEKVSHKFFDRCEDRKIFRDNNSDRIARG